MNNDAKDVIGRLRSLNILLILLRLRSFDFPLDTQMGSAIKSMKLLLDNLVDMVAGLAAFGNSSYELRSAVEDILDPASDSFYTEEYTNMILSLIQGSRTIQHFDFSRSGDLKRHIEAQVRVTVGELLQSIMWLRVGFYDCYPQHSLPDLSRDWLMFCRLVGEAGGGDFRIDANDLAVQSLKSWRFADIVVQALKRDIALMPHRDGFLKSIAEVEFAIDQIAGLLPDKGSSRIRGHPQQGTWGHT